MNADNPNKRLAFLAMDSLVDHPSDESLLRKPLLDLGWECEFVSWKNPQIIWSDYDLAIIRKTWDYQHQVNQFISTLEHISQSVVLKNDLSLVKWNLNKKYLLDLEKRGIQIVPTFYGTQLTEKLILREAQNFQTSELILKPAIAASAKDTFLFHLDELDDYLDRFLNLFDRRKYLLQPFIPSIKEVGEFSLIYFKGIYSHCVRKYPIPSDFRVQEKHGGKLEHWNASSKLINAADQVLGVLNSYPLYSRIDFVIDNNDILLMELELVEPSLFLDFSENASILFAQQVNRL